MSIQVSVHESSALVHLDTNDIRKLTNLLEHLVAFVENKVLDAARFEALVADKSVHSARRANNDVRTLCLVLEDGLVGGHGRAAVEDRGADVWHILGEARVLISDLVRELARVAEDDDAHFSVLGLNLLQSGEDEDGCLSHTRLCLAHDVHAKNRLGDALLLDCNEAG